MRVGRERERGRAPPRQTHGSATTTPKVRQAIQAGDEKNTVLARRYGVNRKTVAKWKCASLRPTSAWARKIPAHATSRSRTRRSFSLTAGAPASRSMTRSQTQTSDAKAEPVCALSLSKRHGLSKIGPTAKCPPLTSAALRGPYCFEISAIKIGAADDVFAEASPVSSPSRRLLSTFMQRSVKRPLKTRCVSRAFSCPISAKDQQGHYGYHCAIHLLGTDVRRKLGGRR